MAETSIPNGTFNALEADLANVRLSTPSRPEKEDSISAMTASDNDAVSSFRSASISRSSSNSSPTRQRSRLNPSAQEFKATSSPGPPVAAKELKSTTTKFYEVREVPGKGFGLFSTRAIPLGTQIICESPLMTIDDQYLHLAWASYGNLSKKKRKKKKMYDNLHSFTPSHLDLESASRHLLLHSVPPNMSEAKFNKAIAERVRVMSIFACNNFKLSSGLGVFLTASRINHSCVPNVHHSWNPSLGRQTIHAIKDIAADEELCTTYLGGSADYQVRAQRIDTLQRYYGFTCSCISCSDTTATSDGRREVMGHIAWGLQQYLEGKSEENLPTIPRSPADALLQAQDLITLLLQEGLTSSELMKAYRTASTQALLTKDLNLALEYAQSELQVQQNILGTEVADLEHNGADANAWVKHVLLAINGKDVTPPPQQPSKKVKKKNSNNKSQQLRSKNSRDAAERLAEQVGTVEEKIGDK